MPVNLPVAGAHQWGAEPAPVAPSLHDVAAAHKAAQQSPTPPPETFPEWVGQQIARLIIRCAKLEDQCLELRERLGEPAPMIVRSMDNDAMRDELELEAAWMGRSLDGAEVTYSDDGDRRTATATWPDRPGFAGVMAGGPLRDTRRRKPHVKAYLMERKGRMYWQKDYVLRSRV